MPEVVLLVKGEVPSKKNLYRAGRGRLYIPTEVKAVLNSIELQLRSQWKNRKKLDHPNLLWRFKTHSDRQDRDNMKTTLLDCMQRAGVITNDNIKHHNGWSTEAPAEIHDGPPHEDRTYIHVQWKEAA